MTVVSVDVPEMIAKKFPSNRVIRSYDLYEKLSEDYSVDFWREGISKDEFHTYISKK